MLRTTIEDKDPQVKCNWSSFHWSFMAREEGCISQDWHMDDEHGHFCIFPMYPCADSVETDGNYPSVQEENCDHYYQVCVIPGTHTIPFKPIGMEVPIEKYNGKVLRLHLEVGQVLIACANVVHCGGPSANIIDMFGTEKGLPKSTYIGALKNLAIHGYLRQDEKSNMENDGKIGEKTFFPDFV